MALAVDGAALQRQIEDLHAASYSWSLACCRYHRAEAEDVLHTAYLKVLGGRARWDGRASLKTWLFAIIRRTAIDRYRRQLVATLGLAELFRAPPEPASGPFESAAAREQHVLVRRALVRLAARQREVVELVFYHDLTLELAAGVMGVSVGTARRHYDRAKTRLGEML